MVTPHGACVVGPRERPSAASDGVVGEELTRREREVLAAMAEGKSNIGIAEALVVTEAAVEKHVISIFQKLGLARALSDHRRVLAVLTYVRAGPD